MRWWLGMMAGLCVASSAWAQQTTRVQASLGADGPVALGSVGFEVLPGPVHWGLDAVLAVNSSAGPDLVHVGIHHEARGFGVALGPTLDYSTHGNGISAGGSLRIGPKEGHVRLRFLDGGLFGDANEIMSLDGVYEPDDSDWQELTWTGMVGKTWTHPWNGPAEGYATAGIGGSAAYKLSDQVAVVLAARVIRTLHPVDGQAGTHAQVVASFRIDVPWLDPLSPPPPMRHRPSVPRAVPPVVRSLPAEWPVPHAILRPGTMFQLLLSPLRVLANVPVPRPMQATCGIDEARQAGGRQWFHMTCAPELPEPAPTSWRTGCYVIDEAGAWRLPNCPGDPRGPGQAVLVLPSGPPMQDRGFIDMGARFGGWRTLRIGGREVRAQCLVLDLEVTAETCFTRDEGLVWSASRWRWLPHASPELAVVVVSVRHDGPMDRQAPHLQFSRPDSAACEIAPQCLVFGECRLAFGRCVAARDEDCAPADVCTRWGRCRAVAGACVARTVEDCRASSGCVEEGRCSLGGASCVVAGDDCEASRVCRESARCTASSGRCRLTSDADCGRGLACARDGACHLDGDRCFARDDADCKATDACVTEGRCQAREGRCEAAPPDVPAPGAATRSARPPG